MGVGGDYFVAYDKAAAKLQTAAAFASDFEYRVADRFDEASLYRFGGRTGVQIGAIIIENGQGWGRRIGRSRGEGSVGRTPDHQNHPYQGDRRGSSIHSGVDAKRAWVRNAVCATIRCVGAYGLAFDIPRSLQNLDSLDKHEPVCFKCWPEAVLLG